MSRLVEDRIKRWKNKLIDLTKRNRLLNFKPTKITTIRIVDESPAEIYETIALKEKSMSFLPIEEDKDTEPSLKQFSIEEFRACEQEELEDRHKPLSLQTDLIENQLEKNLLRIFSLSSSVMEEQGYNSLFLALGFLEWYESNDSDEKLRSPILLLPVQLQRKSVKNKFKLGFGDDSPILNPALVRKLDLDFGIKLEEINDDLENINPQEVFKNIKNATENFKRWKVTNDVFLGLFSFSKFIMYKDLDTNKQSLIDNNVIQIICGVEGERESSLDIICPIDEIEQRTKPEKTFQILDADSSQQRAILVVKQGHNLIIEGPPGTGKSQTIANIIGEMLTEGKKVLFVSEKMAALEVVKNRLVNAGIGDYCLELHSRKTNKKKVVEELDRVMRKRKAPDHNHDAELLRLEKIRNDLNSYVNELHKSFGELRETPYEAIGFLNLHPEIPDLEFMFNNSKSWSNRMFESSYELIDKYSFNVSNIGTPNEHSWFGTRITELPYSEKITLKHYFNDLDFLYFNLKPELFKLCANCFFNEVKTISDVQELLDASEVLELAPNVASDLLKDPRWNSVSSDVQEIINVVKTYNVIERKYSQEYDLKIFDEDLETALQSFKLSEKKLFRFLRPSFCKARKAIKSNFKQKRKVTLPELIKELEELLIGKKAASKIDMFEKTGREIFRQRWNGRSSRSDELQKFSEWVVRFRYHVLNRHFNDDVFGKTPDIKELKIAKNKVNEYLSQFNSLIQSIHAICKFDYSLAFGHEEYEKNEMEAILWRTHRMMDSIEEVESWLSYQRIYQECEKEGLITFINVLIDKIIEPKKFAIAFKCQFFRCWLGEAFLEREKLKNFEGKNHEQLIEKFRGLDNKQIELSKIRIRHLLSGNYDPSWEGAAGSERAILEREVRKKRAHISLRKLFEEIHHLLLSLKPCLMMSPLTVSQFLKPELFNFDLVIFDEASQVPPQDSLGSIVRGKQIVVAGDSKQLPPTSFFQSIVMDSDDDDDESEEYVPTDLDSILDECASVGFPKTMLEWHYRSKHESLIAFSNKYYYENRLNTFPNSEDISNSLGVCFNYLPETEYRKGGVNVLEAEAVAKRAIQHFRENPEISLGIGTFSIKQKYAIEDAIEGLLKEDNSLESYFSSDRPDHFFIKNLESIQGDERDVIFISVGYGKDASGRLPMRFGPINQLGGERRLNVLVTRARKRLEIFSSIKGYDFDLSRTESEGVHLLKKYLEYAELGKNTISQDIEYSMRDSISESPFEESVYHTLIDSGIKVHQQVGCSGYRIDMAVVDKELPGKYILGIECDGASYHSSITARDRDRLRQQVLEGLGWSIYRVWSTDWFKNRKNEIDKLLRAVKDAQDGNLKKKQ